MDPGAQLAWVGETDPTVPPGESGRYGPPSQGWEYSPEAIAYSVSDDVTPSSAYYQDLFSEVGPVSPQEWEEWWKSRVGPWGRAFDTILEVMSGESDNPVLQAIGHGTVPWLGPAKDMTEMTIGTGEKMAKATVQEVLTGEPTSFVEINLSKEQFENLPDYAKEFANWLETDGRWLNDIVLMGETAPLLYGGGKAGLTVAKTGVQLVKSNAKDVAKGLVGLGAAYLAGMPLREIGSNLGSMAQSISDYSAWAQSQSIPYDPNQVLKQPDLPEPEIPDSPEAEEEDSYKPPPTVEPPPEEEDPSTPKANDDFNALKTAFDQQTTAFEQYKSMQEERFNTMMAALSAAKTAGGASKIIGGGSSEAKTQARPSGGGGPLTMPWWKKKKKEKSNVRSSDKRTSAPDDKTSLDGRMAYGKRGKV